MDVQDFLAVPVAAKSIEEAIAQVAKVRSAAGELMAERGLPTLLADEGGLSPGFRTGRDALLLMVEAFSRAGFRPGVDMSIAIDVAASSLKAHGGRYALSREGRVATAHEMVSMLGEWVAEFPVCSIEDGLDEEAWGDWELLTSKLGSRVQLVGDDLFTTNFERLQRGVESKVANGILVKVNQNGTLTGTLQVIARAREAGYAAVISARSGETEDSFIADLSVGTGAGHIKIGSVRCSDRLAKYNQLLRIEESTHAPFAEMSAYQAWNGDRE
ncbi:phosphopyruvate hydratase [Variovorax sp. PDC80]|nr:phosphopyruvate hydratase [Variovorax sp. PDC80]